MLNTALRNHNRTGFEEMSFWTASSWFMGMKTVLETKHIKSKFVRIFIMKI